MHAILFVKILHDLRGVRVVLGRIINSAASPLQTQPRSPLVFTVGDCMPKPDITTAEAFKRALFNAKTIAYSKAGSSGLYFLDLLDRLGIAEDLKAKLKPSTGNNTVEAVVTGEAELVVVGVALILMVPGAELVGWLPSELQSYVVFTGGVSATAKEPEAAKALLDFLTTAETRAILKAKGLEPVTP